MRAWCLTAWTSCDLIFAGLYRSEICIKIEYLRSPDHVSCILLAKPLDRTLDYQVTCTVCIAGKRTITGTLRSQTQQRQSWKLSLWSTPNISKYCGGLHVVASKN